MNIGDKIKEKRIEKNLSVEELAKLINDEISNVEKYEENQLEPTLDKKILLCQELGLNLSDLSYTIEHRYTNIEKSNESFNEQVNEIEENVEEVIERPFATSEIKYNEKVYKSVFQKDYFRFMLQSLITMFGYAIILVYLMLMQMQVFSYIMMVIFGYSLLKFVFSIFNFISSKKKWLIQYDGMIRTYAYYKDYIEVTNSTDEQNKKISYSSIVRVIEKDDFIICLCLLDVRTILIIDKKTLNDENLVMVRSTLKETCMDYIEQSKERKDQQTVTKTQKVVRTINIILFILSLCSIVIINLIYKIFDLDDLLKNHLLVYGIFLIVPVASIIMGIISKKKFDLKAKKNIVVGIVMTVFCLMFIFLGIVNHYLLVGQNNDELKDKTEEISKIEFPDNYYTLYKGEFNNIVINEQTYKVDSYQLWNFPSKKEAEDFEIGLKNNSTWNTNNEYSKYFSLKDEVIDLLKTYGYDSEEIPTYFLLCDINNNILVNNITDGKYIYACYYEKNNCMLVITFEFAK